MVVWILSLPALVVLLTMFAFVDLLLLKLGKAGILPWRRGEDHSTVSATGFEVLHGSISYGKAQELKQRQTELVLRQDQESAAPPYGAVDLDSGRVVVRAVSRP
ncbi:MAG TPA: DUF6191 domain-containing protein [Actinocrinis sp.]|nr:DUF6191 domain-containing protein [Actinocrinis sp.]